MSSYNMVRTTAKCPQGFQDHKVVTLICKHVELEGNYCEEMTESEIIASMLGKMARDTGPLHVVECFQSLIELTNEQLLLAGSVWGLKRRGN